MIDEGGDRLRQENRKYPHYYRKLDIDDTRLQKEYIREKLKTLPPYEYFPSDNNSLKTEKQKFVNESVDWIHKQVDKNGLVGEFPEIKEEKEKTKYKKVKKDYNDWLKTVAY